MEIDGFGRGLMGCISFLGRQVAAELTAGPPFKENL
jgi:hypothetical protein